MWNNVFTNRQLYLYLFIYFNFFHLFIYFFERQTVSVGGAEFERDTESESGFRLQAVSTEHYTGLKLTNRKIIT